MDHLDVFVRDTWKRINAGYYTNVTQVTLKQRSFVRSLRRAQTAGKNAIIAELKPVSPSEGRLLDGRSPRDLLGIYRRAGAVGLSVVTDPDHFGGSLESLSCAGETGLPTLMKDFVMDPVQLDACAACGGSAVLLILAIFRRGYPRLSIETLIAEAHSRGLEVLLEVNSLEEYEQTLQTDAEMIGINHRDLATLQLDLGLTKRILSRAPKDRPVWSLSGIKTPEDVRRLKAAGADAFLVGTSLLRSSHPGAALRELIRA
jgi:indole-3-glycerol phosphate synthase